MGCRTLFVNTQRCYIVPPRIVWRSILPYDTLVRMAKKRLQTLVAAAIKTRRKQLGMTIAELAEAAGIDTGYLAHIETAQRAPSLAVLEAILGQLRMKPQDLFGKATVKSDPAADELTRRTRALLRRLDQRHHDDLIAIFSKLRRPEEIRALRVLLRA